MRRARLAVCTAIAGILLLLALAGAGLIVGHVVDGLEHR